MYCGLFCLCTLIYILCWFHGFISFSIKPVLFLWKRNCTFSRNFNINCAAPWENVFFYMCSPKKTQMNMRTREVWLEFYDVSIKKLCIVGCSKSAYWRIWSNCANGQAVIWIFTLLTLPKERFLTSRLSLCTLPRRHVFPFDEYDTVDIVLIVYWDK